MLAGVCVSELARALGVPTLGVGVIMQAIGIPLWVHGAERVPVIQPYYYRWARNTEPSPARDDGGLVVEWAS